MKIIHTTFGILSVALALLFCSCTNSEKRNNISDENSTDESRLSVLNNTDGAIISQTDATLNTYLYLKDALVDEDSESAAEAGDDLSREMKDFKTDSYDKTDQEKLQKIIEDAAKNAQFISESSIDVQRHHFETLSQNMIELIDITGTSKKLYLVYCPMSNDDKGVQWLSDYKEIKNPYFGSEMIDCGEIQREFN